MYVKDWMAKNVYTIDANATVSKALDIMSATQFHRLPVVDKDGKLLGLLTESLVTKNSPNSSSSLSVRELNYLLNKLTAKDIMIEGRDVITINPDALLEEAASLLLKNDIGCLPVLDDGKVVGIITHNDVFEAFINLLGYGKECTRYVVNVKDDKPGVLNKITDCFKETNINISNLGVYHNDRGIEIVVITNGENSELGKEKLIEKGFDVTSMIHLTKDE